MHHFHIILILFILFFNIQTVFAQSENINVYYVPKSEDKASVQNIEIDPVHDRIISESTRNINAIYPLDTPTNSYPGYRGTNQLVVYTPAFGQTTGTNEFGKEAVVKDGVVIALTGANTKIPFGCYVVSGHGSAKKWINDNLKIGTQVQILDRTIRAYTTVESYRYQAKAKIKQVQEMLISTKYDSQNRDDKVVYNHLKKAKQKYKKSKKDNSDAALMCAKEAINEASLAFRYTLPYIKSEFKGVWIRPNSKNTGDIQKTLDNIKAAGFNNVFIETFYHGKTIFPSRVMKLYDFEVQNPDFLGTDILAIWIKEAHKRNIKVHCWFESFYIGNKSPDENPNSILAKRPNWMNRPRQKADYEGWVSHAAEHNGFFLDPANPEVVDFLMQLIGELSASYNIDGINVDYVRYPSIVKENYSNQWGYTQFARNEFMSFYEVDPIELDQKSDLWTTWCNYRSEKITNYVRKVSELLQNRNIIFSTVIFPDYKLSLKTKFQDWITWSEEGYVNAFTPMVLTGDDELTKSMLEEIKKKSSSNTKIYPGLYAGFIESDPEDLLKQIHITRKLHLGGVVLFDWAHLNSEYLDTLKTSVFRVSDY